MKKRNPHIGGDALAEVRRRVAGDPRLRARIDASVVRATIAVMVKRARTPGTASGHGRGLGGRRDARATGRCRTR